MSFKALEQELFPKRMNDVIICVGISGSGKSSWCTQQLKTNNLYLRINRDAIRLALTGSLDGYYQRSDLNQLEVLVTSLETELFHTIVNQCKIPLIDNTSLKLTYINKWIYFCVEHNLDFKFKFFDPISLEECENRVKLRDNLKDVSYIQKQFDSYQEIKEKLTKLYPNKIL